MIKRLLPNLLLLLAACLLAAVLVEASARWFLYGSLRGPRHAHMKLINDPHPTRGWMLKSNEEALVRTLDFISVARTNARGLNSRDIPYEKPEGVFRIVILGDSFMFAREVERRQGLPALLEQALHAQRVEVVNLGIAGYGTLQELLFLREEGLKYQPDLVIHAAYFLNDIRDNSRPLNELMWGEEVKLTWGRPYAAREHNTGKLVFTYPDGARLLQHEPRWMVDELETQARWKCTASGMLLRHVLAQFRQQMAPPQYDPQLMFGPYIVQGLSPESEALWEAAWEITAQAIVEMAETSREAGAKFVAFTVPDRIQVDARFRERVRPQLEGLHLDLERPERRLVALGEAHGFPVLNLVQAFREATEAGGPPLHFQLEDQHWSPAGHAFAAECLLRFLRDQRLLPDF